MATLGEDATVGDILAGRSSRENDTNVGGEKERDERAAGITGAGGEKDGLHDETIFGGTNIESLQFLLIQNENGGSPAILYTAHTEPYSMLGENKE